MATERAVTLDLPTSSRPNGKSWEFRYVSTRCPECSAVFQKPVLVRVHLGKIHHLSRNAIRLAMRRIGIRKKFLLASGTRLPDGTVVRKAVRAGRWSITVTLPSDWVERNGVYEGQPLYIRVDAGVESLSISTRPTDG